MKCERRLLASWLFSTSNMWLLSIWNVKSDFSPHLTWRVTSLKFNR
jgi:hypothetical protein